MMNREQHIKREGEAAPLRKNVDSQTERLGITQVRGNESERGKELVTVVGVDGKKQDVWISRDELAQKQETADAQFDQVLAAVTVGREGDHKAISELFQANKESLLKLGRKEADPVGSLYRVMEDAADALEAYDKGVERIISETGYTGLIEDGLRNELMKEKNDIFTSAWDNVSKPRGSRSFEQAVHAKLLAASAKHLNLLKEILPLESPELELQSIEEKVEEVSPMESVEHSPEQRHIEARYINSLQRTDELFALAMSAVKRLKQLRAKGDIESDAYSAAVQEDDQYDAAWKASKNLMRRIEKEMDQAGLDPAAPEFATKTAREVYMNELRSLNEQNQRAIETNIREQGRIQNAPDFPEDARGDWEEKETTLSGSSGPTLVPLPSTAVKNKAKPPSRFGRALRKVALPLLAILGIQSGTGERSSQPDLSTPQREVAALNVSESQSIPEGTVEDVPDEMEVEYAAPTKEEVDVKRLVREPGDPQNLKDALKILSVLPGTKWFNQMRDAEKAAQTRAALEDFKVIKKALTGSDLKGQERKNMETDFEQAKANWDSIKSLKEALEEYPE